MVRLLSQLHWKRREVDDFRSLLPALIKTGVSLAKNGGAIIDALKTGNFGEIVASISPVIEDVSGAPDTEAPTAAEGAPADATPADVATAEAAAGAVEEAAA